MFTSSPITPSSLFTAIASEDLCNLPRRIYSTPWVDNERSPHPGGDAIGELFFCHQLRTFAFLRLRVTKMPVEDSNVGVSRSLYSKLNGMYAVAKSYVPSAANSSLHRIENGVVGLIERNVSPKVVSSIESKIDNLLTPTVNKINSTIEVVRFSKNRLHDIVQAATQMPKNLQECATNIALDSIQRVDNVVDYVIPATANATDDTTERHNVDVQKSAENDQAGILELPEKSEGVERSVATSSKNLLHKVNKRVHKKIWQQVASAQGFAKRNTEVIHTNLIGYASTVMDYTVPGDVRAMYDAVLEFPDGAIEVYAKLAAERIVDVLEFRAALQQKMGDAWVAAMGPAAEMYCKVVNGIVHAKELASQTRDATASRIQSLLEGAITTTHTSYTVVTERTAIVFNKAVPVSVREAASAYLKRVKGATDLSAGDSFLRKYSSAIAAVISLVKTDLNVLRVRFYNPTKKAWESRANFEFGTSLVSLLAKVPTQNFSKIYGLFQALLSVDQIENMRDFASKTAAAVQFRVGLMQSIPRVIAMRNPEDVSHVCNDEDTASNVICLDDMAERVYANLRNAGEKVDLRPFLSTLRTQFEVTSGQEWTNTLLNTASRLHAKLVAEDVLKDEEDVEISSASEGDKIQNADQPARVNLHAGKSGGLQPQEGDI